LIKNKFEFFWQKHIQPSEVDTWDYWFFEEFIKLMNQRNKEEAENNKKQSESQNNMKLPNMSSYNPASMMNKFGGMRK